MDKYICRAKDIGTGEWVYGYPALLDYMRNELFFIGPEYVSHRVNQDTICRYTGLNDKQDNPIFEGDIITARYVDDGRLTKGVVNFLNGCFCVKYDNYNNPAMDMLHEYDISGNVFDNTELMEG